MIENQRPFQLIESKTGNRAVAYAVGFGARVSARALYFLSWPFGKKAVKPLSLSEAGKNLKELYPFTESETKIMPLAIEDGSVDVSVIIPAYNAEKYIISCVDSVLGQKTAARVEVIVVNDNSGDKTMERLLKYGGEERVLLVDKKDGGSAAKARNEGLLHAKGRYIMFLDSDDFLPSGAIETLYGAITKSGADICQGGWQYIEKDETLGLTQRYINETYTGKKRAHVFDLPGMPWGKIYTRGLFDKIRFPESYCCFEDSIVHFLLFRSAKKIISVGETVYLWRKNPSGITATSQNSKKAVLSALIVKDLLKMNDALGLEKDSLYLMSLTMQLSNFCYANVRGLSGEEKEKVFAFCSALYKERVAQGEIKGLPYVIKNEAKALLSGRFDLWEKQGKLFQLMN